MTAGSGEQEFIKIPDNLSVADDTIDEMVRRASIPNLANLYVDAKKSGHIKPVYEYADVRPTFGPTVA